MPDLDQREECAFGGGFGLAESIPPRIFPGPTRCETARNPGRSTAGTQSANEYHHKRTLCIWLGFTRWDLKTDPSWCQLGGGCGRIKGDKRGREGSPLRSVHILHIGFQKVNR